MWRAREVCLPGALVGQPQKCPADVCLGSREQGGPHPGCSRPALLTAVAAGTGRVGRGSPLADGALSACVARQLLPPARSVPLPFSSQTLAAQTPSPRRLVADADSEQPSAQEVPPGSEVTAPSERGLTASTESRGAKTACRPANCPRWTSPWITALPARALSTEALFLAAQAGNLPKGLPREKG